MHDLATEDIAVSIALRARDTAAEARWLGFLAYAAARGCPTADDAEELVKTATRQAAVAWNAAHFGTPDHGRCPMVEVLRRLDDLLAEGPVDGPRGPARVTSGEAVSGAR